MSETGLSLFVPVVREGDDDLFGVEAPVRMILGLPSGVVEARGITARYSRDEEGERGALLVGVRITEIGDADSGRLRSHLGTLG